MLLNIVILITLYLSSGLCYKHYFSLKKTKKFLHVSNEINDVGFNDLFEDDLIEINDPLILKFEDGHTIPNWLRGSLLRNGPAVFGSLNKDKKQYTHIFDGLAKLSRFTFGDNVGEIQFQNSFIKSSWYEKIVKNNNDVPPSVTTGPVVPSFSLIDNIYSALTSSSLFDNVPVNIHKIGTKGPIVATTDAPIQVAFNPDTLETIGKISYKNSITYPGGIELFSTAHPHYFKSKVDNDTWSINYFLEMRPLAIPTLPSSNIAHIVKINSNLERHKVGSIALGDGVIPYVHDFSITENYAILMVFPLFMNPISIINGKGFLPQLEWKKHCNFTQIYVFDLNKKKITFDPLTGTSDNVYQFQTSPMWAYHHINAFEKDNTIVVDVNGYETPDIVTADNGFAYIQNVKDRNKRINQVRDGNWFRILIPMQKNGTFIEYSRLPAIDKNGKSYTAELLRTNDNLAQGVERRYSYGFTGFPGKDRNNDYGNDKTGSFTTWSIVKLDHHIAQSLLINNDNILPSIKSWSQCNCYPSESIFVSKDKDNVTEDSDDGVVLSVVYDGKKKQSFLLVLDGITMKELGRVYLTKRIPFSFHGTFLS